MTRNAIYYKVKRVIPFIANSTQTIRFGANFNGKVLVSTTTNPATYLWTYRGASATSIPAGDIPDLSAQYDQYRIAGVSLKWYPGMPNGSIQGAYAPMAIAWDRDGIEGNVFGHSLTTLMEQTNGVTVKNAYRPWKKYIKAPKKRINTNIPSLPATLTPSGEYLPNNNLAGQWIPTDPNLNTFTTFSPDPPLMQIPRSRGTHLLVVTEAPDFDTQYTDQTIGTLVVTTYLVYMDRK